LQPLVAERPEILRHLHRGLHRVTARQGIIAAIRAQSFLMA
jgi:hypothetical protein